MRIFSWRNPSRRAGKPVSARQRARLTCEPLEERRLLSAVPAEVSPLFQVIELPDFSLEAPSIGQAMPLAFPAVAADAEGNYVVAWIGELPDAPTTWMYFGHQMVLAQRYNAAGERIGDPIIVREVTPNLAFENVQIAVTADGGFVVAWQWRDYVSLSTFENGTEQGVSVQRFSSTGEEIGQRVELSRPRAFLETLQTSAAGDLLVVYRQTYWTFPNPPREPDLFLQRYDTAGIERGSAVRLAEGSHARLAVAADGSFVAVWRDNSPRSMGIVGQMFAADGVARGVQFRVSWLPGRATSPVMAMDAEANFVIAWDQEVDGAHRVFAERRDADGKALGPAFEIGAAIGLDAARPSIAMDAEGNFYITWDTLSPAQLAPDPYGMPILRFPKEDAEGSIRARLFDAGGQSLGDPFDVGTVDAEHGLAASAVGADGKLILTWLDGYIQGPVNPAITNAWPGSMTFLAGRNVLVKEFTVPHEPRADLNGPAAGLHYTVNYQPGSSAISIVDAGLRISDIGTSHLASATLAMPEFLPGDALIVNTAGTNIADSYVDGVLRLVGVDSIEHYEQVLRSLKFVTTADRPPGSNISVAVYLNDGETLGHPSFATISIYQPATATIAGRHIFYNNSAFDGNDRAASAADDVAIASEKTALLPGGTASFANISSYPRGINGIMIDFAGSHGTITAADFEFHVGERDRPGWSHAPPPRSIFIRPGAGVGGSDRVEILWDDGAIQNAWLQVTVLANGNTGLAQLDAFYFGSVVAETGHGNFGAVTSGDLLRLINYLKGTSDATAAIDNTFDLNRDGRVTTVDAHIAINQVLAQRPLLFAIAPPGSASVASNYYGLIVTTMNFDVVLPIFAYTLTLPPTGSPPAGEPAAAGQLWEDEGFDPLADDDEPAELLVVIEPAP
jgi:hypothetical protein